MDCLFCAKLTSRSGRQVPLWLFPKYLVQTLRNFSGGSLLSLSEKWWFPHEIFLKLLASPSRQRYIAHKIQSLKAAALKAEETLREMYHTLNNSIMNTVYIKTKNMKSFKAFDIERGITVKNVIFASSVENTDKNRGLLQNFADEYANINLAIQLRNNGKVIFQTK